MTDECLLIFLALLLAVVAVGMVVALLLSFREPEPYEPAIPDVVPSEWGGDRNDHPTISIGD